MCVKQAAAAVGLGLCAKVKRCKVMHDESTVVGGEAFWGLTQSNSVQETRRG